MSVILFLEVLALVLLTLAAVRYPEPTRVSFGWSGVALLCLCLVFNGLKF